MANVTNIEELDGASSNVIYITEEHRIEWTHEATKELLKLYDEKCDMLDSGIISTQKKLWELVSKDMYKKGYYYTGSQCENKWKTLKRNYRNKLEKLDKFGHKRSCPFENEITEILSKRPQDNSFSTRSYMSNKIGRFKRRTEDPDYEINLNYPPGFSDDHDSSDVKNVKLIQSGDSMDDEMLQNTEFIVQDTGTTQIVDELAELKKVLIRSTKLNSDSLKQSNELSQKIVQYLEGATQRECQTLELEETRMEQQNEIIKQMKVQNGLLQKLLEKIG